MHCLLDIFSQIPNISGQQRDLLKSYQMCAGQFVDENNGQSGKIFNLNCLIKIQTLTAIFEEESGGKVTKIFTSLQLYTK